MSAFLTAGEGPPTRRLYPLLLCPVGPRGPAVASRVGRGVMCTAPGLEWETAGVALHLTVQFFLLHVADPKGMEIWWSHKVERAWVPESPGSFSSKHKY